MNTKQKVEQILTDHPHTRDSDPALFRAVIGMTHNIEHISYSRISALQEDKVLPSHESMRRCRQKLQETNPWLRADMYSNRQELANQVTPLVNSDFDQATLLF